MVRNMRKLRVFEHISLNGVIELRAVGPARSAVVDSGCRALPGQLYRLAKPVLRELPTAAGSSYSQFIYHFSTILSKAEL